MDAYPKSAISLRNHGLNIWTVPLIASIWNIMKSYSGVWCANAWYLPFMINIEDKLEKLKSLISIAAIDIKLRYCRYSTTWSSRYSHTASIILTAFSPSSWPWALPQSYGLPGKQEEIYMFPLTFFLPYLKLSAITFMFYP